MTDSEGAWQRGQSQQVYAILAEMAARGEDGVLATVIRTARSVPRHAGSKMIIRPDGSVTGSVGGGKVEARVMAAAQDVLRDGRCQRVCADLTGLDGVCGGEVEVFLEPVTSAAPFWIVGAGHVGRALWQMGAALPFRFHVVDDRSDFLSDLGPAQTLLATPADLATKLSPTSRSVIVLASRNHELDGDYLEAVFQAEQRTAEQASYLGVVGSRTKARVMAKRFADHPQWRERFAAVACPVGLHLGAETPEEIALSILAEVLAVIRGVDWVRSPEGRVLGLYRLQDRPAQRGGTG